MTRMMLHAATLAVLALALGACSDPPGDPPQDPNNAVNNDPNNDPCPEGTAGCPCAEGDTCQGELVCEASVCVDTNARPLSISDPDARACDLILEEGSARILGASFATGVRGVHRRRAPNVTLSFFREGDQAFEDGSVALRVEGEPDGFTLRQATCYDRLGKPLEGVEVNLN